MVVGGVPSGRPTESRVWMQDGVYEERRVG